MSSLERIPAVAIPSTPTLKQTTCPYCGVGCGVDVQIDQSAHSDETAVVATGLKGTPEHPANFGRLCVKGSQLLDTLEPSGRLEAPQVDGREVSWDEATTAVASRFKQIIDAHGPDSVALYVSGQLLTEDYYVANKLMKGYIGSANIDTNSRLCMSSAVAAQKKAFGSDAVPCSYEDLELAEMIVFVGSNAAWTHPVLFQRIERAKQLNPDLKLVFVDPRKTASCEQADLHLQIKPGTDVALFNGLLNFLAEQNALDHDFIAQSVEHADAALAAAKHCTLEHTADICDVDIRELEAFYSQFSSRERVISFYSMGVNQSSSGVDKANSIINCHLVTGKIGKPGAAPFSITGQPNAMGGREVGGLANLLASHLDITNAEHRNLLQEYWQSPAMASAPGAKAVELFQGIEEGKIKAVWVMATNPLVSMPNRNQIERALEQCECVVVSDYVASNDTLEFADIKLPATSWSEKDGTVTNSERRISRQRCFLPPYKEARHDWKIISDVASAMGYEGFDFASPHEVFLEYAGLTGYRNEGHLSRDLDLSGLAALSAEEYEALKPIQWPVNSANPNGSPRLFTDGRFYTESGKANCIALEYLPPAQTTSDDFPFVLNTGRLRDQWHTMTRTGTSAALSKHIDEARLSMHPDDAHDLELREGDYVSLSSAHTEGALKQVVLPVTFDSGLRKGDLFAPIHWGRTNASSASIAYLFSSDRDALSGQPELKHAAVALEKVSLVQSAYFATTTPLARQDIEPYAEFWSRTRLKNAHLHRIANAEEHKDLAGLLSSLDYEELMHHQTSQGSHLIVLKDGVVVALLSEQADRFSVERAWIEHVFSGDEYGADQVHALLHGEQDARFAQGRLVCSCYNVGEKSIRQAISEQGCDTVEKLGAELKCGTNCGSCKSELRQLIANTDECITVDEQQASSLTALDEVADDGAIDTNAEHASSDLTDTNSPSTLKNVEAEETTV